MKEKNEGRLFDDHLFSVQQNPGRGGGRQNKKTENEGSEKRAKRKNCKKGKGKGEHPRTKQTRIDWGRLNFQCSRRRSPEDKPSRNTRSGCKSRRAPGLVILRYGGSPAKILYWVGQLSLVRGWRVNTGRRPDLREDYDPTALHSAVFSSHSVLSFWSTEEIGWMDNLGNAYWTISAQFAFCVTCSTSADGFITGSIVASGKVVGS